MKKELDFLAKRKIACGVLVFLAVTLLCLLTNLFSFYKSFLLGVFGLVSYPLIVLGMAYCVLFLMNKVVHFDKKTLVLGIITLSLFLCILQMALTSGLSFESFSEFIADSYNSKSTPGGALFSILVYPFKYLLFDIGAYIVFSIAIIALITYSVDSYYDRLKSQNKNAGARFDRYEQTPKDAVMELRASVDRIANTNYYKNQNMPSFNNQNADNFDNNYDNDYQGQNSFGNECKNQFAQTSNNENNQSVNMFESDKSKEDKLLTERVKAKLGLIDNVNEEYEQEECEDSKSVAFRTLYPDKCKDGKKASNFDKNNLGNSLSRYFDNNTSVKRESKEYKEKYKDYTTSKAQISYEYLSDDMKKNVQFDGIINGDEYKAKKTSSTIFSEKDKKNADNVINDLKSKPKVRIKVEEKRIGDCLIMSNVETYDDVESSAYSNGGDEVDKFATSNGGGNGVNKDYNEINNNANYINQNGIINASEYSSGNSARDYENNISANKYADLKTCNENSNSYKNVKEFASADKKQKEIIKPILKVDDEVVNVSISTDFDSFGNASDNDYQVEKEKRSTILPNSDNLTLNKDCQSENIKTDDEIIFNNFATHKESEVDNLSCKESEFNDFESERNSEENEFDINNSYDDESQNVTNDNEDFDSNININQNQFKDTFINNFESCENDKQFNANDDISNAKVDAQNFSKADFESVSYDETVVEDAGVNKFNNSNYNDNKYANLNNRFNASINSVNANVNGNNLHNSVNNKEVKANDFSNQNQVNNSFAQVNINKQNYQRVDEVKEEKKESVYEPPKPYNKPPIDLLTVESTDMSELVEDTVEKAEQLESALESFKVPAKVSNVIVGPAVTRYEM
ncbi:MAG: DNA translocase FtsK, partial [Christensenellales bacterium]